MRDNDGLGRNLAPSVSMFLKLLSRQAANANHKSLENVRAINTFHRTSNNAIQ